MTRTLKTAKGKTVHTPYSDGEALVRLQNVPGTFAADLRRKLPLSHDQMVWAHALVLEFERPAERETVEIGNLSAVIAMFTAAKAHLKHPKIRLALANNTPVCLSVAGPKASKPGSINVTDGGKYMQSRFYGRIYQDGTFEIARAGAPEGVAEFLTSFAQDPIKVASEYGHMSGNCCFCNRTLTDERSTTVGYGPVCADHFGLAWGSKGGAERVIRTMDETDLPDISDQIERERLAAQAEYDAVEGHEYDECMAGRL